MRFIGGDLHNLLNIARDIASAADELQLAMEMSVGAPREEPVFPRMTNEAPNRGPPIKGEELPPPPKDNAHAVPKEMGVSNKFYSLAQGIMKNHIERSSEQESGSCGTWAQLKQLTTSTQDILDFTKKTGKKDSKGWKAIKKYLKSVKNEKQLLKKIKKLKSKKAAKFLEEMKAIGVTYLGQAWSGNGTDADVVCSAQLPEMKALVAVEKMILEKTEEYNVNCGSPMLDIGTEISFQKALQDIASLTTDENFMNKHFAVEDVLLILSEMDFYLNIGSPLIGILGLRSIQHVILGRLFYTESRQCPDLAKDCRITCSEIQENTRFRSAVARIAKVIDQGTVCTGYLPTIDTDVEIALQTKGTFPVVAHLQNNNGTILGGMEQLTGFHDALDLLPATGTTAMVNYFWKPYLNLPLSESLVKKAYSWLAMYLVPFSNCEQFVNTQVTRVLVGSYSQYYYLPQLLLLDQCGPLPSPDPRDSMIFAGVLRSMAGYNMNLKYDYTTISEIVNSSNEPISINDNTYERNLYIMMSSFVGSELSLELDDFKTTLDTFREFEQGSSEVNHDIIIALKITPVVKLCLRCEVYQVIFDTISYGRMQHFNIAEGRVLPFEYEQSMYREEKAKVMSHIDLRGCQDTLEEQLGVLRIAAIDVVTHNAFQNQGSFRGWGTGVGLVSQSGEEELCNYSNNYPRTFKYFTRAAGLSPEWLSWHTVIRTRIRPAILPGVPRVSIKLLCYYY